MMDRRQLLEEEEETTLGDEEEFTFSRVGAGRLELEGGVGADWCLHCSTAARVGGRAAPVRPGSGACEARGCPGYRGHPPAGRPQGEVILSLTQSQGRANAALMGHCSVGQ